MEPEKTPKSHSNVEKEKKQTWRHYNSGLYGTSESSNHQDSMGRGQKQTHRSKEQNRESRNGHSKLWLTKLWQNRKEYPKEKKSLFSTWYWEKWTVRRMNLDYVLKPLGLSLFLSLSLSDSLSLSLTHTHTHTHTHLKMDERSKCKTGNHQNPRGENKQPTSLILTATTSCLSFLEKQGQ